MANGLENLITRTRLMAGLPKARALNDRQLLERFADGDETAQYYYGTRVTSDWKVGSRVSYDYPDGTVAAEGEVLVFEPTTRLEMTFLAHWDPEVEADGPITHLWELEPEDGATKLTVTSRGLKRGSKTAASFGSGIIWIVSGLKTFVEGGRAAVAAG